MILLASTLTITGLLIPIESFSASTQRYLWWPMWDEIFVLLITGILLFYFYKIRKIGYGLAVITLCSMALITDIFWSDAIPKIAKHRSSYTLATTLNTILQNQDQIFIYNVHPYSISFYLKPGYKIIPMESLEELSDEMDHSHQSHAVLYKSKYYPILEAKTVKSLYTVYEDNSGRLILSNHP